MAHVYLIINVGVSIMAISKTEIEKIITLAKAYYEDP